MAGIVASSAGRIVPSTDASDGEGELVTAGGDYLKFPPKNNWVGGAAATTITIGQVPDAGWQTVHGWIYDQRNGNLWAGSFDANDQPYPKP